MILAWVGTLVFTGLTLLLWSLAFRAIRLRRAMKRWPVVTGIVYDHRTRSSGRTTLVDCQVSYHFANEKHLVWCGSPTGSGYSRGSPRQGGVDRDLARFPVGSQVDVYVNPARPREAYLKRPEQHIIVLLLCGGVLFLIGPVAVSPLLHGLSVETVDLLFYLVLGGVLTAMAISMGIALFHAHFPGRPQRKDRRGDGDADARSLWAIRRSMGAFRKDRKPRTRS